MKLFRGFKNLVFLIILLAINSFYHIRAQDNEQCSTSLLSHYYEIDYRLDLDKGEVYAKCKLTVKNVGESIETKLPFLLYRKLRVKSITTSEGNRIPFTQKIVKMAGEDEEEINAVIAVLPTPVKPAEKNEIIITYSGIIDESHNITSYVRDSINKEFSLLRLETRCYPFVSYPNKTNFRKALEFFWTDYPFDYKISVTVPKNYIVANVGKLIDKKENNEEICYLYENKLGAWRIDFAVANYEIIEIPEIQFKMFVFPEDKNIGEREMMFCKKTNDIFTKWFEPLTKFRGFTIIETPEWDGGQNDETGVIMPKRAFNKNSVSHSGWFIHELVHNWGPETTEDARWANEGQASYLQNRVFKELTTKDDFFQDMNDQREYFVAFMRKNPEAQKVSLDKYMETRNDKIIHIMSYQKGSWLYYILDLVVGDDTFNKIITQLYQQYNNKLLTNEDFKNLVERISKRDLSKFWQEWLYSSKSTELLMSEATALEIAARYK